MIWYCKKHFWKCSTVFSDKKTSSLLCQIGLQGKINRPQMIFEIHLSHYYPLEKQYLLRAKHILSLSSDWATFSYFNFNGYNDFIFISILHTAIRISNTYLWKLLTGIELSKCRPYLTWQFPFIFSLAYVHDFYLNWTTSKCSQRLYASLLS